MNDTFKRDLLKLKPFENFSHLPMSDTFFLWGSLVLECMMKLCWDKIYQKLPNVISSYYIILHYHKIVIYTVKVINHVLIIKLYQLVICQLYKMYSDYHSKTNWYHLFWYRKCYFLKILSFMCLIVLENVTSLN